MDGADKIISERKVRQVDNYFPALTQNGEEYLFKLICNIFLASLAYIPREWRDSLFLPKYRY